MNMIVVNSTKLLEAYTRITSSEDCKSVILGISLSKNKSDMYVHLFPVMFLRTNYEVNISYPMYYTLKQNEIKKTCKCSSKDFDKNCTSCILDFNKQIIKKIISKTTRSKKQ